jgi:hypothetical protein
MTKLLSLVFVLLISCAPVARAMPVEAFDHVRTGPVIRASGGCGLGVRRGFLNECAPVYDSYYRQYYRGHHVRYRSSYYVGPYIRYHDNDGVVVVNKGVCGFGSYLACGYGTCWQFCY